MDAGGLRAFEPILFQEIGPRVTYNANFCRNPMCPNFGPAPDAEAYRWNGPAAVAAVDPGGVAPCAARRIRSSSRCIFSAVNFRSV